MAPTVAVDLPTADFGRWAARSRLVLPVPLNAGYAAAVDLPWDELLQVSDDRVAVRNQGRDPRTARAARDLEPRVRELLPFVAAVLRAPDYAVFAGRTTGDERDDLLVVGFGKGLDGLVVADRADTVRLVRTSASDLASSVAAALPACRPAAIQSAQLSAATLTAAFEAGSPLRITEKLTARTGSVDDARTLAALATGGSATGIVGALAYGKAGQDPSVSERDAMWVEGRAGAVLRTALGSQSYRIEAATRGALVAALIAALEDARRGHKVSA